MLNTSNSEPQRRAWGWVNVNSFENPRGFYAIITILFPGVTGRSTALTGGLLWETFYLVTHCPVGVFTYSPEGVFSIAFWPARLA
ncbi:MAG: hypothetical protein ABJF95_17365, partial [Marinobacter sp.]|uniref:hypothetical protein n=1 Tax=Marinobacter sp. TaxID=50741 RepID=UPI00326375ED